VLVLLVVVPAAVAAQAPDLSDSKDHPSISRYAGSVIHGYDFRKFDELVLPLGPVAIVFPLPRERARLERETTIQEACDIMVNLTILIDARSAAEL
jgi:hypothetical protein